jgi:hypothetical protein
VLDAGAGVGLVAEEVLEGEEAGDGVEVLRGGEERELEDVAGDEGCGGDDVCGAAAELGEGAGVGLAGDEGADAGDAVLEEAAAAGAEVEDADAEGQVSEMSSRLRQLWRARRAGLGTAGAPGALAAGAAAAGAAAGGGAGVSRGALRAVYTRGAGRDFSGRRWIYYRCSVGNEEGAGEGSGAVQDVEDFEYGIVVAPAPAGVLGSPLRFTIPYWRILTLSVLLWHMRSVRGRVLFVVEFISVVYVYFVGISVVRSFERMILSYVISFEIRLKFVFDAFGASKVQVTKQAPVALWVVLFKECLNLLEIIFS